MMERPDEQNSDKSGTAQCAEGRQFGLGRGLGDWRSAQAGIGWAPWSTSPAWPWRRASRSPLPLPRVALAAGLQVVPAAVALRVARKS